MMSLATIYERVFIFLAWIAERRCLSDRATGLTSTVLNAPVFSALGVFTAYLAWWPIGAAFTLAARLISVWGVLFVCLTIVLVIGRNVARAMTFPSSVPMIQRQIEQEVAQNMGKRLTKAIAAVASAAASPYSFVVPATVVDIRSACAVLQRMREENTLSTHGAFTLHYCELFIACVDILAASASTKNASEAQPQAPRRAVIPASLRSFVSAAPPDADMPIIPLPSVFFCSSCIAEFTPSRSQTLALLSWLVRRERSGGPHCAVFFL